MSTHYIIFRLNNRTGEFLPYVPRVDGRRLIFMRRKDAKDYAYDNQVAGGLNQRVEYRAHDLPQDIAESGTVYRGME